VKQCKNYVIFVFLMLTLIVVHAQTRIDAPTQIKNLNLSPIRLVERSQCIGSGTATDGSKWDCTGIQMIRITLDDGTILGPYVNIPMSQQIATDSKWQSLPLKAADPIVP
jgi:hypothetical protein